MDYETVILITDKETEYNDNEFHETGRKWPQVKTTFVLKRRAFQHILQTFFPACCLGPDHLFFFFCVVKAHARVITIRNFHPSTYVCTHGGLIETSMMYLSTINNTVWQSTLPKCAVYCLVLLQVPKCFVPDKMHLPAPKFDCI